MRVSCGACVRARARVHKCLRARILRVLATAFVNEFVLPWVDCAIVGWFAGATGPGTGAWAAYESVGDIMDLNITYGP